MSTGKTKTELMKGDPEASIWFDRIFYAICEKGAKLRQEFLPQASNAFFYRFEYARNIFDLRDVDKSAFTTLVSSFASIYATIVVCVYVVFAVTELVTYPIFKEYLEVNGFFIYLFSLSVIYFLFILYQVFQSKKDENGSLRVVENDKSHGSFTVRIGAIIFGLGALIYLTLQLIDIFEVSPDSLCYYTTNAFSKRFNVVLMVLFVILQAFVIFTYPRLNLLSHQIINRYGTYHVVATNIILWLRTLIKESLEEISEAEEEHRKDIELHINDTEVLELMGHTHSNCSGFLDTIKMLNEIEEECKENRHGILGDAIVKTTPFLYPFIIEFALIGASVTFVMSNYIGIRPHSSATTRIKVPNLRQFLMKTDFSHSIKGIIAGFGIVTIALVNLSIFFGLEAHEHTENPSEYLSKISNCVINLFGLCGLIIGIAEIQKLKFREEHLSMEADLDMKLLRFTSVFAIVYMLFTILTGSFNSHLVNFPDELHVINGVISIAQISLQITFINNLKQKKLPPATSDSVSKPGRQITIFLFLLNLSQWLVYTFEVQKVRASLVEADFYGFMPWVVIRRVTLPLTVFFRFHSAVVFIELFKEVYSIHEDQHDQEQEVEELQLLY